MNYQEEIDDILDYFDFEKVHKAMEALDWEWVSPYGLAVPLLGDLRKQARQLLTDAFKKVTPGLNSEFFIATGGFIVQARTYDGDNKIYARLAFEVSSNDNWD